MDRVSKIGFSGTLGITQKMGDKLPFNDTPKIWHNH